MLSTNLIASSTVGFVTIISATLHRTAHSHPRSSNFPFLTVPCHCANHGEGCATQHFSRLPASMGGVLSQIKKSSPPGGHAIP